MCVSLLSDCFVSLKSVKENNCALQPLALSTSLSRSPNAYIKWLVELMLGHKSQLLSGFLNTLPYFHCLLKKIAPTPLVTTFKSPLEEKEQMAP